MGKYVLETEFDMITQIAVMGWWAKGSPSVGAVVAAHGSVHRAHTCDPSPSPPVHPGSLNQGADRAGCCIGHTE